MSQNGNGLGQLRHGFSGTVHAQDDSGYEEARGIFNSMITRRPSAIAAVADADDGAAALAFARTEGLEVAVRGGGHSVAGACLTDGGVTIDMRAMNKVTVDHDARTATAQGGALWGDFDRACEGSGLMAPSEATAWASGATARSRSPSTARRARLVASTTTCSVVSISRSTTIAAA